MAYIRAVRALHSLDILQISHNVLRWSALYDYIASIIEKSINEYNQSASLVFSSPKTIPRDAVIV